MHQWLIILLSLLCIEGTVCSQTPAAFNYQAIIRNQDKMILADQVVTLKLSILQDSETGDVSYAETHELISNAFGQITAEVGEGEIVSGDFSNLDWGQFSYFLKTEIDPGDGSGFIDLGASRLLSVPYALHAGKVDMPLKNLEIKELEDHPVDDPLFEVKRADGSVVFGVYNEGVRVYVEDSNNKGIKGGFAVGGYSSGTKGYTNEYLRVTPDSVRVYVNENQQKRSKGGFAVGGYQQGKAEPASYFHLDPLNYFIGQDAGKSNTTGFYNSFFGYQAGYSNTVGENNFFQGYQSGYKNDSGYNNIFIGKSSGYQNISGTDNVFIGVETGRDNKTGILNTFVGHQAGMLADSGRYNTLLGFWAGYNLYGGHLNTFVGAHSGHFAEKGEFNTVVGAYAGSEKDFGSHNTYVGMRSGSYNEGDGNTILGSFAGLNNEFGNYNVIVGNSAGENSKGDFNVYIGESAGLFDEGSSNVFIGRQAGQNNKQSERLFIENWPADSSLALIYGEFDNDILRFNGMVGINCQPAEPLHVYGNAKIDGMLYSGMPIEAKGFRTPNAFQVDAEYAGTGNYISFGDPGVSEDFIGYKNNTFWLLDSPEGGDSEPPNLNVGGATVVGKDLHVAGPVKFTGVETGGGSYDLRIDEDGTLQIDASDARLKTALAELEEPLKKVLNMKAYVFSWKDDAEGPRDVGFIAQEVSEVMPEVVYTTPTNGLMGINYSRIPALLVEAIKEQQQIIESRDVEIKELKERLERLENIIMLNQQ